MNMNLTKYILLVLVMLLFGGTAAALSTNTHGTVHGEMYVASTANWLSKVTTNNFDVPNGTVVYARYYAGVWGAGYSLNSISTTFNGHAFPTNPAYYSSGMGVTWIPYDITDHVLPGEVNTATINSGGWGDGRQYGSTIVVVLENEGKPQIEYWVAEGLDWMHYADYLGYDVPDSTTYFNGTVDLTHVQSASLYSTHLTGFNYEDLNGNSLPGASESVGGEYFNYIRWDNLGSLLVPENQTVLVSRLSDTYCSVVFHALAIEYAAPDLVPVDLTPYFVSANATNTMTATIENQGSKNAQSFNVSLMVDGTVVDMQTVSGLASGGSTTVDLYWMPDHTGTYPMTVSVDPDNAVLESDEINNELTGTAEAKERPGKTVSMTTNILPAVSFVVTPGTLNFGKLAAGETSDAQTLTLENKGGFNISVTADVTDTANDLFVNGVLLDSAVWSAYGTSIAAAGSDTADAALDVPDDYAGVGAKVGTLMFWAEAE
jgi:hypothetical protein